MIPFLETDQFTTTFVSLSVKEGLIKYMSDVVSK